jgi:septum formation inhibitor-activating ATPase MinD
VESILSLGYHYVLIDCPAGIDVGFINAISPAKEAIIVTTPEITSIRWGEGAGGLVAGRGQGAEVQEPGRLAQLRSLQPQTSRRCQPTPLQHLTCPAARPPAAPRAAPQ